ncbi:DUF1704 domain-containing protein [bacterium]|nr:DUF1704 domain-containing protein [bacterium]
MWATLKERVRDLSERIVLAQRPIRILNAIKTPERAIKEFKASNYKDIPKLGKSDYDKAILGFDTLEKKKELSDLDSDISTQIGKAHPELARLLSATVRQYSQVVDLLESRGSPDFYAFSKKLYGSSSDPIRSDKNTVFEMAKLLYRILSGIKNTIPVPNSAKTLSAQQAVDDLSARFLRYFGEAIPAILSDGVVADAAAGGDVVKIRSDRFFSPRDLDFLEVHEGWVHVGTSLGGRAQPVAKWLSVGPPRCTSTQEGLAVLMEIFTFRSSVTRAQKINDRIIAIAKAEEGANLIEVFEYFRTEGYAEEECLTNSMRVFRGTNLRDGAFTKDLSYCRGFVENYNFLRAAIRANKPFLIPFLFAGKLHVEDIPLLYQLHQQGIVTFPKFLPPQFSDINGLAVWMSFSSFFNKVDLKSVQSHYNSLFRKYV